MLDNFLIIIILRSEIASNHTILIFKVARKIKQISTLFLVFGKSFNFEVLIVIFKSFRPNIRFLVLIAFYQAKLIHSPTPSILELFSNYCSQYTRVNSKRKFISLFFHHFPKLNNIKGKRLLCHRVSTISLRFSVFARNFCAISTIFTIFQWNHFDY